MPTLNGACPGCGQTLTLEVTVRTAPRGFTSDSKQVQLVGDREPGQGGTPSTIPPVNTPPPPTPPPGQARRRSPRPVLPGLRPGRGAPRADVQEERSPLHRLEVHQQRVRPERRDYPQHLPLGEGSGVDWTTTGPPGGPPPFRPAGPPHREENDHARPNRPDGLHRHPGAPPAPPPPARAA